MAQPFCRFLRLVWIDMCLEQGNLNRADIAAAFGTSIPQAAIDLKVFGEENPGSLEYDHRARTYRRAKGAKEVYPLNLRVHVQTLVMAVNQYRDGAS